MKNKDIEKMLREKSANAVIPDMADEVKRADLSRYEDGSFNAGLQTAAATVTKKFAWVKFAAAAAAAGVAVIFAFVIIPRFTFDKSVYATVTMEGNPSFAVSVNKNSQVVDITTGDGAGENILKDLRYKERDFTDALTELLKVCDDAGCFSGEQLSNGGIIFVIDCRDADKIISLRECIDGCIRLATERCRGNHGQDG